MQYASVVVGILLVCVPTPQGWADEALGSGAGALGRSVHGVENAQPSTQLGHVTLDFRKRISTTSYVCFLIKAVSILLLERTCREPLRFDW